MMNSPEEQAALAERFQELYEIYDKSLSEGALRMLVQNWGPRDLERLDRAIFQCLEDPARRFLPTVGELKAAVGHLDPTKDHSRVKGYWMRKPDYRPTGMYLPQAKIDEACEALGIPLGKIKYGEIDL